jgi:uncharacterized cupredoxin-like copper-binding protein
VAGKCSSPQTTSKFAKASKSNSCSTTAAGSNEFVLATTQENLKHAEAMKMNPEMEHYDPNARRVTPKNTDEIVWKFTKAGRFEFACLIPGHRDAGMFGTVDVK